MGKTNKWVSGSLVRKHLLSTMKRHVLRSKVHVWFSTSMQCDCIPLWRSSVEWPVIGRTDEMSGSK